METTTNELLPLAEAGIEVSLSNIHSQRLYTANGWNNWEYRLTDSDIDALSTLLGGHYRTQNTVANKLRSLYSIPSHWSFNRITFCKHSKRWSYTAGQDYPGELQTIRNWFKNL